ncbi:DEAD/DEAH box helicase [Lewinella sp. LCG006]|uniref:DEAD/DEAH box helicase n=1 Tax=Lewinella sp. LCG006 TaxID=3231911 RepID=UPI0034604DFB
MNKNANYIKNRLSLRKPQEESLRILAEMADQLRLDKINDAALLAEELEKVTARYPTSTDFERNFPSLCFALATGVGKTRLAGAFVAYLYLEKGIRNFFILAPNLTIYNKLIEDFSNPAHPKYVFQGIGQFVNQAPRIITGDNYQEIAQTALFESDLNINVFNISKINSETRGGSTPNIRKMVEYLGEPYFDYLSGLDDLVMIMDESHHYRAARGMEVLNELNPIIGLELTATPQIERGNQTVKFKNVVYEYSLARAIQDGFVKTPAIATRKDFDPSQYSKEELDRIKLEDGLRIHEDTKVALDIFARDNNVKTVKPFVLVVAKDTPHASRLKALIESSAFFDGYYADKVIEIHSNQRGSEKDENIAQLVSLESEHNRVEIVIHVNMLKEGWDVTNLYTIIPLRTAASMTLREQTIGRGLRLPYGKRTGDEKVDRLTIVAHDRFQEIVDAANAPDSIIRQENIIQIDEEDLGQRKEVVTATSLVEKKNYELEQRITTLDEPEAQKLATQELEARRTLLTVLPEMNRTVRSVQELSQAETRKIVIQKVREQLTASPQQQMFVEERIREVEAVYDQVIEDFTEHFIEIPRISIVPDEQVRHGFRDFDLDTGKLNLQPGENKIMIRELQSGIIEIIDASGQRVQFDTVENMIVGELINFAEIDYDEQAGFLFKLAGQAVAHFRSYLDEDDKIINVVQNNKRLIGKYIHTQMMDHFYYEAPDFQEPVINVRAFTEIRPHNYTKYTQDNIHDLRDTIVPTSAIRMKVFTGFTKACHHLYKFDSKTEKDFAIICEQDDYCLKWLRPAQAQFRIYYRHNSRLYQPDFVVETPETIYMVETKKENEMESQDVLDKARAAEEYCKHASTFTGQHGGKNWVYVLIPHGVVQVNMGLERLVGQYGQ